MKRWKQICIENMQGDILAIEYQKYPIEAQDHHILELHNRTEWIWNTYDTKTNGTFIMRVNVFSDVNVTWREKIIKRLTGR